MKMHITLIKAIVILLFLTSIFMVGARALTPIETQDQLDVVLIEEAALLGLRGHNLEAELSGESGISSVKDYGSSYHITLRPSFIPGNRATLRHELFHVYDRHGDDLRGADGPVDSTLILLESEIKAETYAITGYIWN